MKSEMVEVYGQPSWRLATAEVEAFVTRQGGHLGPVTFHRQKQPVRPLAVAPWAEEEVDSALPSMLQVLRGDFFCMPFGGNELAWRGEQHPPHGETANEAWTLESLQENTGQSTLHLQLKTKVRPGRVDKKIQLRAGHNAVYSQHIVSGLSGPMNLGHHAMLQFSDEEGSGLISTNGFRFGQVFPGQFEDPQRGGQSALLPGAEFETLERVPLQKGGTTDLSRYPARRGYEDLVLLAGDETCAQTQPFAWTAAAFPRQGYVWFALKDPNVLRSTIFWLSNGGRPYAPWNGRHVNVMGLEEVTSYFHLGLAESAQENSLSQRGVATTLQLDPHKPLSVNTIMAVARIPETFGHVTVIEPFGGDGANPEGVKLFSQTGATVTAALDLDFLQSGADA